MVAITVPTDAACDLIIAANEVDVLAYQEVGDNVPVHSFSRANNTLTQVHPIAGRQYPIAFRPQVEGDSDVFARTLLIAMDTAGVSLPALDPGAVDRWPFDPLIALVEDPTAPWISLIDGHGRRWYTFPEFVSGSYSWEGCEHQGTVKFTEVQGPLPSL